MRLLPIQCAVLVLLVAGCASSSRTEFNSVPGPSNAALPNPPVVTNAPASVAVAQSKTNSPPKPKPSAASKSRNATERLIMTPTSTRTGNVVSFNRPGRFVVLSFPIGYLPGLDQKLEVYRKGLKVGEVKITGPQRDDYIVADLTKGEAQSGDEVRAP